MDACRRISLLSLLLVAGSCLKDFTPGDPPCSSPLDCTPERLGSDFSSLRVCDPDTRRCLKTSCGNRMPDEGEECDDGNLQEDDACRNDCTAIRCGDGILDLAAGEVCDDGNEDDDDACRADCRNVASCGDGVARTDLGPEDEGYEECDDANISNIDDCLNNCLAASCGDGFRAEAEPCDDGNDDPTDFCNDCVLPECGDGHIQPSNNETCDDTNEVDNDACSNECRSAECGDGILRVDLQPDDHDGTLPVRIETLIKIGFEVPHHRPIVGGCDALVEGTDLNLVWGIAPA